MVKVVSKSPRRRNAVAAARWGTMNVLVVGQAILIMAPYNLPSIYRTPPFTTLIVVVVHPVGFMVKTTVIADAMKVITTTVLVVATR